MTLSEFMSHGVEITEASLNRISPSKIRKCCGRELSDGERQCERCKKVEEELRECERPEAFEGNDNDAI